MVIRLRVKGKCPRCLKPYKKPSYLNKHMDRFISNHNYTATLAGVVSQKDLNDYI